MGYKDPNKVVAPKTRWELTSVICNTGQNGWSAALGIWDGSPDTLAIRWNGDDDSGSPGNPQSHGNPTWFIVPRELDEAVRGVAFSLNEAINFVKCRVWRPDEFQVGVFRVEVAIEGKALRAIEGHNIQFDIPELPKRLFRSNVKYMVPPSGPGGSWRGNIHNGYWEGIFQTNGIPEEENPTHTDVVRDGLVTNVIEALKPWLEDDGYDSTSQHPI